VGGIAVHDIGFAAACSFPRRARQDVSPQLAEIWTESTRFNERVRNRDQALGISRRIYRESRITSSRPHRSTSAMAAVSTFPIIYPSIFAGEASVLPMPKENTRSRLTRSLPCLTHRSVLGSTTPRLRAACADIDPWSADQWGSESQNGPLERFLYPVRFAPKSSLPTTKLRRAEDPSRTACSVALRTSPCLRALWPAEIKRSVFVPDSVSISASRRGSRCRDPPRSFAR